MKLTVGITLAGLMLAPLAAGQKLEMKFDAIAAKASAKHEVDLEGPLLKAALGKAAESAGKEKEKKGLPMAGLLSAVQGVHVRNYEFDKPGAYSDQELDPLRKQVGEGSGWSRVIGVKERNESTEIFLLSQGEQVSGCLILVAKPKELTVVHVVGTATLAQMKELVNSNVKYDLSALMGQAGKQ
jgi:hypothetical protein